MKNIKCNNFSVFAFSVLLTVLSISAFFAQASETNKIKSARNVSVGDFIVKVPINWRPFSSSESDQLRHQYMSQSEDIYRQYSAGAPDPAKSINIVAYHFASDEGAFAIVSFTVPPQSDLVNLLKDQAEEKAKWGIEQGYIKKYLGLVPFDNQQFSGFYVKSIGMDGNVQISSGLEHKKLKNTLIQLTLLCPKSWDVLKATNTLTSILESVKLKEKNALEAQTQLDQLNSNEQAQTVENGFDSSNDVYIDESYDLIRKGLFSSATEKIQKILKTDPNNALALNNLGVLLAIKTEYESALSVFLRAKTFARDRKIGGTTCQVPVGDTDCVTVVSAMHSPDYTGKVPPIFWESDISEVAVVVGEQYCVPLEYAYHDDPVIWCRREC